MSYHGHRPWLQRKVTPVQNTMPLLLAGAVLALPLVASGEAREVQSLDGTWHIVFDPGNEGREKEWLRD